MESKGVVPGSKTKLPKPVQEFILMIFDVDSFHRRMLEMEIDLSKLPLGIISESQVKKGFEVLSELETAINSGLSKTKLNSLTNK